MPNGGNAGKVVVMALKNDLSSLLETSYSNSLSTGNFAGTPLTLEVDGNGSGTLTYATTYKILSTPEHSGGITCRRMYNEFDAFLDCTVPWKGTSEPAEKLIKRSKWQAELATSSPPVLGQIGLDLLEHASESANPGNYTKVVTVADSMRSVQIGPRGKRVCKPWAVEWTVLAGNGNPHQNCYDVQTSVRKKFRNPLYHH